MGSLMKIEMEDGAPQNTAFSLECFNCDAILENGKPVLQLWEATSDFELELKTFI